jgi:hypothetical protein
MNRPAFVYVAYIATTPEKLWTALTDGDFTRQIGEEGASDPTGEWARPSATLGKMAKSTGRGRY